jgi:uncharacterized protein YegJ (DUF2314 family)
MKRVAMFFLGALLVFSGGFACTNKAASQDVIQYGKEDARMNAAIEEARKGLPRFFEAFAGAPEEAKGAFKVKVALDTADGGHEHIWVGNLHWEGEALFGRLVNVPERLPGLSLGSQVRIERERISDWSIASPEGFYGSYTSRVMIDDLPPAQADQIRRTLAPTPLPASWTT